MSYEQAPATKLLATHCIFCSRPLLDAASVEAGIGPVCREKVGYNDPVPDAIRKQANKYIHQLVTNRSDTELVKSCIALIGGLGMNRLANTLEKALADVKIEEQDNKLYIEAPYLETATPSWRRIPGRIFDRDTKRNVVPAVHRQAVWALLKKHYPGVTALGPKGMFKL